MEKLLSGVGFVFLFSFFALPGFAQKFDKGNFVDFDYGPHGVYGARPLDNTKYKEFWHLSGDPTNLQRSRRNSMKPAFRRLSGNYFF